jgi:hypothetical protein
MNISRQDAAEALATVESVDQRMDTLRVYRNMAPFLQLWGAVWLVANVMTQLWPRWSSWVWLPATCIGCLASVGIVIYHVRRDVRVGLYSRAQRRRIRLGFLMIGVTVIAYFTSMALVLGPLDGRQSNAFISLFWAFIYMATGAWAGPRLFLTGAVAVVGIVAGYLYIHEYFALWMGFFGGGSLMLAGLWLRRP